MPSAPYIDAHAHIWTSDVARYPLAPGFAIEDMDLPSFTAEELLAHCRPAGVGRANLIQMVFYGFDNSYMLDTISRYPDDFVGTAIVDPLGPDPANAMRTLRPRGVRGFRIAPNYSFLPPDCWLEPPGYAAMFATAAETRQVLSCLIDPNGFAEVDRMARQFPETTVIIDHLGRIGAHGSVDPADVAALCGLAKYRNVLVKVSAFYALGRKSPPYSDLAPLIQHVIQAFGANRCMWESDCPFQVMNGRYADSLDLVRHGLDFLNPDDKEWLLWRTAEQTFFSGPVR
jgi:predicted TIM-barrel fold metal-dependent hydrolase